MAANSARTCRRWPCSVAASLEEVVRLHSDPIYLVFMLGFLPGFAYLGQVDERIAAPRLETPAGSGTRGFRGHCGTADSDLSAR